MRVAEYCRSRPFALFAPALAAGIVASALGTAPLGWGAVGAVATAALLAGAALLRRGVPFAVVLFGIAAGFARHEIAETVPATDVSRAALPAERVRVRGTVLERPRIYRDRQAALEESHERHDERAEGSFAMDLAGVEGLPGTTGRVRVQFYRREVRLVGGEELELEGKLRHPRPQSNPGGADRRAILARDGIGAVLVVGEKDAWTPVKPAPIMSVRTTIEDARDAVRGAFQRHARPDAAAFLAALVIGSRENLPEELVQDLQRSGTAHFLAVSGQNLAIVLMFVAGLLTLAGVRGPPQHALVIVVLFAYTVLSGWQVSVVRAFLMAAVWLGAHLVWRRSDPFNSLCVAAAAIVLGDPGQVFLAGFQLSFLAVIGILWIAPIFHDFAAPSEEAKAWWRWPARQARAVLAVSIAAWLATAPVVLANFHLMTPVILAANLALVPLILFELAAGLAIMVLAPVVPPAADAVGWLAGLGLDAIAGSSSLLTRLPGAYVFSPALPGWATAAYYAGLAAWAWRARARRGGAWLCAAFALWLALPAFLRERPDGLFVATIDVGRGSATYVEWPDGRNLVFDCGSLTHRDAGATVVAPYLWSRGVRRVDTLVLSHGDADHVNGARSLIERMRIRQVITTRYVKLDLPGVEVRTVERRGREPETIAPGIEVLGPPTWEKWGREVPANETSIVMRIEGRVLLTGDIEERGAAELLALGDALVTEVLMVPHHGKKHGLHRALAAAVAPRIALVSAPEGYYAPEVVEFLEGACRVFRTGRDGCVELTLRGDTAEVHTFLRR